MCDVVRSEFFLTCTFISLNLFFVSVFLSGKYLYVNLLNNLFLGVGHTMALDVFAVLGEKKV